MADKHDVLLFLPRIRHESAFDHKTYMYQLRQTNYVNLYLNKNKKF